jgi:TetR/AcrR family transcriptional regulator, regulator of autoinduction and epiphytic fitness
MEGKRSYHSPRRQQQAEQTRRHILETARQLFAVHGYTATTLPAIAREAGVSAPTVTAIFGTKVALVHALIQMVVRGNAGEAPVGKQSWWLEMLAEPDPRQLLRRYAAICRQIQERSADVYEITRGAATAEPEIAELMRAQAGRRREDARSVAEALARKDALDGAESIDRAADIIWALPSAYTYSLLVSERGWSGEQYEEWLASSLINSVLGGC